jgi:hypothetical protein
VIGPGVKGWLKAASGRCCTGGGAAEGGGGALRSVTPRDGETGSSPARSGSTTPSLAVPGADAASGRNSRKVGCSSANGAAGAHPARQRSIIARVAGTRIASPVQVAEANSTPQGLTPARRNRQRTAIGATIFWNKNRRELNHTDAAIVDRLIILS